MKKVFTALAFIAIGTLTSACQPDAPADTGHVAFTERLAAFRESCGLKFGPTTDGFKNCVAAALANDPEMGARIVKEIDTKKASNLHTQSVTARMEAANKSCFKSGLFPQAALNCFLRRGQRTMNWMPRFMATKPPFPGMPQRRAAP
jgi:hypothetical protein